MNVINVELNVILKKVKFLNFVLKIRRFVDFF